jgi:hypothetical protein
VQSLDKKTAEIQGRLSKATIELVGLREQLTIARVRFQEEVADLTLEPAAAVSGQPSAVKH